MGTPYTPPGTDPTGNPHPVPSKPQPAVNEKAPKTTYDERAVDLHEITYSDKRPCRKGL